MKVKEKMLRSASRKRSAAAVLLAVVIALGITGAAPQANAESADYSTNRYDVKINVNKDNSAYVTENIGLTIDNPIHGIYRYIPRSRRIEYTSSDGTVLSNGYESMELDEVSVTSDPFKTEKKGGTKIIHIGDAKKTVKGVKDYELSYRVRFYDDDIDKYDSFYYNVLPSDWETPIASSTVTIVMPKPVKKEDIDVRAGTSASEEGKNDRLEWELDGRTIVIRTKGKLPQGTGVTVGVKLPEGYFKGELTHRPLLTGICAASGIAALLMLLLWFRFGRDKKTVRTVEFYPPDGITPADIGYIIDGRVDRDDVISLLFYFAQKGYISIEEEGKNDFVISRRSDIDPDAKPYEKVFFKGLFESGERVRLNDLSGDFYDTFSAVKEMIRESYSRRGSRIFPRSLSWTRILTALISLAGFAVTGLLIWKAYTATSLLVFLGVSLVTFIVSCVTGVNVQDRKYTKGKFARFIRTLISLVLLAASAGSLIWMMHLVTGNMIFTLLPGLFVIAGYFAMRYMQTRTRYGTEILGKVLGFREFIRIAEKNRLEKMMEQDPQYFYDIIPYAYVMGLSKKWAKKFEDIEIPVPDWYSTLADRPVFNAWIFYNMCSGLSSRAAAAMTAHRSDTAAGSFGSGGASAGGGSGGGGGGSW